MSNYTAKAFNPATKQVEQAEFLDNFFGPHRYGVRFGGPGSHVWQERYTEIPERLKEANARKST